MCSSWNSFRLKKIRCNAKKPTKKTSWKSINKLKTHIIIKAEQTKPLLCLSLKHMTKLVEVKHDTSCMKDRKHRTVFKDTGTRGRGAHVASAVKCKTEVFFCYYPYWILTRYCIFLFCSRISVDLKRQQNCTALKRKHRFPPALIFREVEPFQKCLLAGRTSLPLRLKTHSESNPDHFRFHPPATGIMSPPVLTCVQQVNKHSEFFSQTQTFTRKKKKKEKKRTVVNIFFFLFVFFVWNQTHQATERKNTWDLTQQSSWLFTVGVCATSK